MSRVAKKTIVLPPGVSVDISLEQVSVKGPLGTLVFPAHPAVTVEQEGRFQRSRSDIPLMLILIAFLTEECCSGHSDQCVERRVASKCAEELFPPLSPTTTKATT